LDKTRAERRQHFKRVRHRGVILMGMTDVEAQASVWQRVKYLK
jgi:hypothetical protein